MLLCLSWPGKIVNEQGQIGYVAVPAGEHAGPVGHKETVIRNKENELPVNALPVCRIATVQNQHLVDSRGTTKSDRYQAVSKNTYRESCWPSHPNEVRV